MKCYFFKFTKLPFVYTMVKAANSVKAKEIVSKFRSDGVYVADNKPSLTFSDYHNQKFIFKKLEDIIQKANYEITSAFTGETKIIELDKCNIVDGLIKYFSDIPGEIPGIKKASKITIGGKSAFGIKNSDALKKWVINQLGSLPIEMQQKQAFIPICFVKETSKKTQDIEENIKLLEKGSPVSEDVEDYF